MSPDFWTAYWAFVAFTFGAIVGSFLNVCIWRIPRGESVASAPSHCPACNHQLHFWPDMIPLFSQLWSRSRCRYCGERFSWRYFWVELLTACVFTAIYLRYVPMGPDSLSETVRNTSALLAMLFAAALITIFFIDLETYQIPDLVVLAAVLFAVVKDGVLIAAGHRPLWQAVPGTPWSVPIPLSLLGGLIALWLLWQFAALATAALGREAMGAGDSLLLAAMGAFLIPWPLLVLAFMAAVLLGTVGGLVGIYAANREEAAGEPPPAVEIVPPSADEEIAAAPAEQGEGEGSSAEPVAMSRGMAEVTPPAETPEEPEVPALPPSSRWGRVLTVLGSWLAVGGVWVGAMYAAQSPALGITVAVGMGIAAAACLYFGLRAWLRGDQEWLPAMDELFEEGEPGPRFIPFGPYLVAGTFVAMLFGRQLIEAYWKWMMLPSLPLPWD